MSVGCLGDKTQEGGPCFGVCVSMNVLVDCGFKQVYGAVCVGEWWGRFDQDTLCASMKF